MMAGGNPDEERGRAEDDFYPTPPEVTQALLTHQSAIKTTFLLYKATVSAIGVE